MWTARTITVARETHMTPMSALACRHACKWLHALSCDAGGRSGAGRRTWWPQKRRPAPLNSRPRQTLNVTSESSVCMSSPRSFPT